MTEALAAAGWQEQYLGECIVLQGDAQCLHFSVSEAKVRALTECGVRDPHTGTSTDCLAIAATQRGSATPYAGSATGLGRTLGRAVFEAACLALGPAGREGRA